MEAPIVTQVSNTELNLSLKLLSYPKNGYLDVTNYELHMSINDENSFSEITSYDGTSASHTLTSAVNGIALGNSYTFKITSQNSFDYALEFSETASITMYSVPVQMSAPTSVSRKLASFEVEWTALADQTPAITSYELQWDGTDGSTFTSLFGGEGNLQVAASSYTISSSELTVG